MYIDRRFPQTFAKSLTNEELRSRAPSIFAERPMAGVSNRYRFVSTAEILDSFRAQGWQPVDASEQHVRSEEREGFQMHQIRLSRFSEIQVGEARGDIVLTNSHDRSSAYKLFASVLRLVCSNGLVIPDSVCPRIAIRHANISPEAFEHGSAKILAVFDKLGSVLSRWQSVQLSDSTREEFAARAARLRWPEGGPLSPVVLLAPKREADRGSDLWHTMNVVQEHLLRGRDRFREGIRVGTTRPVRGIAQGLELNRKLWGLAEQYALN